MIWDPATNGVAYLVVIKVPVQVTSAVMCLKDLYNSFSYRKGVSPCHVLENNSVLHCMLPAPWSNTIIGNLMIPTLPNLIRTRICASAQELFFISKIQLIKITDWWSLSISGPQLGLRLPLTGARQSVSLPKKGALQLHADAPKWQRK